MSQRKPISRVTGRNAKISIGTSTKDLQINLMHEAMRQARLHELLRRYVPISVANLAPQKSVVG